MSKLEEWFSLSYAGWITIPRCLTKQMPQEWQDRMGELLKEYDETFTNWPDGLGCRVQLTDNGKLTKKFNWLHNYRYSKIKEISKIFNRGKNDNNSN